MQSREKLDRQRNVLLMRIENFMEGPMVFLGIVWLVLLVIELTRGISPALEIMSLAIWAVFIVDFGVKLILAPSKTRYFRKNWLTVLSLIIPAFRVFRFLRVFRLARGLRGIRLIKVVGSLNRSMRSLSLTMRRRGVKYVVLLTIAVIFGGGAGMYEFEKAHGLNSYGEALWWTAMLITSIASEYWPKTGEGKVLCFLLSVYGLGVFGYITASLASFFVGRDAEEKSAPIAGANEMVLLRKEIEKLAEEIRKK